MSASDYAFLADQYPEFRLRARSDRELEDLLDAWFAHDHLDDNPERRRGGPPMSQVKTYTIAMIESEIWLTDVDAESEEEALAKAQAAYGANGHDDFSFKDAQSTASRWFASRRPTNDRHPPSPAA
jgi:hypothetical protein